MPDPHALWQRLDRQHPQAARLAVLSSLPVRVSPSFLRLARLRLLDTCDTGNEADLWLSDLVEARSAAGFSYRSEVRDYLRERLATDRAMLERVWHDVHLALSHWLTPKAQLEEELTWRLLRDPDDPAIDAQWRAVLAEMEQGSNAEGVARWVLRALPELPAPAFANPVAGKLWIAAHLLLGDTSVLGDRPQRFLETGELAFATRKLPRQRVHVGMTGQGLLVSPLQEIDNGHEIDIPLTHPLWIQLETPNAEAHRVLTITDNEPTSVEHAAPELVLRLIDGSAFRIADPERSSAEKFIRRARSPRVQITYDVEVYGAEKQIELPFVTGVMADLSGHRPERAPVADRKFVRIDRNSFLKVMHELAPRLELTIGDGGDGDGELRLSLAFTSLDDFAPGALAQQLTATQQPAPTGRQLRHQLDQVLHHDAFQQLEGSWLGLHHLVSRSDTDLMLSIRVLDITKSELAETLQAYRGAEWTYSPIFKKLYEEEYGQLGGEPFGCLVGDYYFDHSPGDVDLLKDIGRICAAMHAPFMAGVAPSLLQMEQWTELGRPQDLQKILDTPDHAAWMSLRESDDSRYLALTLPRFLARLPYGPATVPVEGLAYEETVRTGETGDYTWANAAYLVAGNVHRAFKRYGWCAQIRGVESGGTINDLPAHMFPADDGSIDQRCPTEIAISDRREAELSRLGFMPLVHRKNTDMAAFFGAQSLHKPAEYKSREQTIDAELGARLPFVFACARFAQYVKCIARDKVGAFKERDELEKWLNTWILNYVHGDPEHASLEAKARYPLAAARILLQDSEEHTGSIDAHLYLRPHYQLEGLSDELPVVTSLPGILS